MTMVAQERPKRRRRCLGSKRRFSIRSLVGVRTFGPANIKEQVVVDQTGNRDRGTFTIDRVDTVGSTLAHVVGEVIGNRITVP